MSDKRAGQSLLENAYRLSTPEDNVSYYDAFAASYDGEFADALGYNYPAAIAVAYRDSASGNDTPVADVGCGTGLVASALRLPRDQIDGIDISAEMLRSAERKGLYRALYRADLTKALHTIAHDYGAVVSAGTFTFGHLGPEPLRNLLTIARPGALFVIGVRAEFFQEAGFEPVLREMEAGGRIRDLRMVEVPVYSKKDHDHAGDTAFVLVYRKG